MNSRQLRFQTSTGEAATPFSNTLFGPNYLDNAFILDCRLKEFITQHCLEAAGAAQNHSTQTLHNVAQLDHIKSMVTKMVQDMAAGEQGEGRCEE